MRTFGYDPGTPRWRAKLKLRGQRVYEKTATIGLQYDILRVEP